MHTRIFSIHLQSMQNEQRFPQSTAETQKAMAKGEITVKSSLVWIMRLSKKVMTVQN